MFLRCAVNSKPMNSAEQDWPVKNGEQRKDYPNRNPNATPPFSLRPRIFLLIIFHEHFILWTALERATGSSDIRLKAVTSSLRHKSWTSITSSGQSIYHSHRCLSLIC